jgi:hypothetical protein
MDSFLSRQYRKGNASSARENDNQEKQPGIPICSAGGSTRTALM